MRFRPLRQAGWIVAIMCVSFSWTRYLGRDHVKSSLINSDPILRSAVNKVMRAQFISRSSLTILACLTLMACGPAQNVDNAPPDPTDSSTSAAISGDPVLNSLIGSWDVSLYYDPDSPPAPTELVISDVFEDGRIAGTFYQSPFSDGRAATRGDIAIISVITSDGSGAYHTSGRLYPDGRFEGQTLSTGRGFLTPWTAERKSIP